MMLRQAIASDDPVVFFEPKRLYHAKGEVDLDVDLADAPPMGLARVAREGTDVTLLTYGAQVATAMDAAIAAEDDGISIEVIDLRSISPVDYRTVAASVRKTGRVVVTHEAAREAGVGAELIASVTERCFNYLEAAPVRVTGHDIPYPPAKLEKHHLPDLDRILDAVDRVLDRPNSLSGGGPVIEDFRLPDLGEGLPEAELVQWLVAEGDTVTLNQTIAEVETAKAIVELPSPFAGTVVGAARRAGRRRRGRRGAHRLRRRRSGCRAIPQPEVARRRGRARAPSDADAAAEKAHARTSSATAPRRAPPAGRSGARARRGIRRAGAADTAVLEAAPHDVLHAPDIVDAPLERPRSTPPVRKLAKDLGVDLALDRGDRRRPG